MMEYRHCVCVRPGT